MVPILSNMPIENPAAFKALLMPCLYGVELDILSRRGVKPQNMFALEREQETWETICNPPEDQPLLHGIRTTWRPMEAVMGIDYIEAEAGQFNLIYLDFFSQPNQQHIDILFKIFRLDMLAEGAKLLLTFGRNRCRKAIRVVNQVLLRAEDHNIVPTGIVLEAALRKSRYPTRPSIREWPYESRTDESPRSLRFLTLEVDF